MFNARLRINKKIVQIRIPNVGKHLNENNNLGLDGVFFLERLKFHLKGRFLKPISLRH